MYAVCGIFLKNGNRKNVTPAGIARCTCRSDRIPPPRRPSGGLETEAVAEGYLSNLPVAPLAYLAPPLLVRDGDIGRGVRRRPVAVSPGRSRAGPAGAGRPEGEFQRRRGRGGDRPHPHPGAPDRGVGVLGREHGDQLVLHWSGGQRHADRCGRRPAAPEALAKVERSHRTGVGVSAGCGTGHGLGGGESAAVREEVRGVSLGKVGSEDVLSLEYNVQLPANNSAAAKTIRPGAMQTLRIA